MVITVAKARIRTKLAAPSHATRAGVPRDIELSKAYRMRPVRSALALARRDDDGLSSIVFLVRLRSDRLV